MPQLPTLLLDLVCASLSLRVTGTRKFTEGTGSRRPLGRVGIELPAHRGMQGMQGLQGIMHTPGDGTDTATTTEIPAETQLPARQRRHPQAQSESYLHFLSGSALSVANAGGGTARSRQLRLHTQRRVLLQRRQRAVRRGVRSIAAVNEARRTSKDLGQRGRNAAVHRHRVSNGTAPDRPGKVLGHRDCDGRRPGHPLPKPWICSWHHRKRCHTNRRALPNTGATKHLSRGIPANYASS